MSIKLVARVWELDVSRPERMLLLALADHARDDGTKVYPSVGHLTWKTGYVRRQVQRVMATLRRKGVLAVVHPGGGEDATEYRLHLELLPEKPAYRSYPRHGDAGDIRDAARAGKVPANGQHVTPRPGRRGTRDMVTPPPATPVSPQPLVVNVIEPLQSPPAPPYDHRTNKRRPVEGPMAEKVRTLAEGLSLP